MARSKKNREESASEESVGMQEQISMEPETSENTTSPAESVEDSVVESAKEDSKSTDEENTIDSAEADDMASPDSDTSIAPEAEDDGVIKLTLSLPVSMFEQSPGSMQRLKAAINSKQTLLKKALGTDSLDVVIEEDRVTFPWFTTSEEGSPVEVDAYSKLVFALAKKAITQTRVDPIEKVPEDLQLGMRLYLINLNFKGDEFKSARAVLMKNFKSSGGANSCGSTNYELVMPEVYKP